MYEDGYFIRVTDDVKPRREYTIPASAFDEAAHKKLNKPATAADGTALPPKYTPEAMGAPSATVPPTELPPYKQRSVAELKDEIGTRNAARVDDGEHISTSGNKAALVAALEADDESYVSGAVQGEEPADDSGDDGGEDGDVPAADHESLSDSGQ